MITAHKASARQQVAPAPLTLAGGNLVKKVLLQKAIAQRIGPLMHSLTWGRQFVHRTGILGNIRCSLPRIERNLCSRLAAILVTFGV